jgi:putative tryptophan/tyrosine transport system substrate-binding protein
LDAVFAGLIQLQAGGLVIGGEPFFNQLAALSIRHAVPAVYQLPEFTAAGGLASYGGSLSEAYRLAGLYSVGFSRASGPPIFRSSKPQKSS